MRKKTLFQIVIVLLMINIAILYVWNNEMKSGSTDFAGGVDGGKMKANEVVATVGSQTITFNDWQNRLIDTYGKDELANMINAELVRLAGKEKGITIDEKVISRDIALLATMQHGLAEEEIEREKLQWHDQIVYRYTLEALLTEGLSVDESQVQTYYDTYKNQYNFSESMQISHIIVSSMKEAEQVKQELDEGAPFTLLAQEYSLDEDTRNNGGYLGHISASSQFMPTGYFEVALELEPFSYSDPFETDQGAVILYLHEHYPSYEFTYEELRPYIERELLLKDPEERIDVTDLWEIYNVKWLFD